MRRHLIGIIALLLLAAAVTLWIWRPQGAGEFFTLGAFVRVGTVMAALWLAYPQVHRMPAWFWFSLPALLIILAIRPKWFLVAVPIVIALAILKPQIGKRQ